MLEDIEVNPLDIPLGGTKLSDVKSPQGQEEVYLTSPDSHSINSLSKSSKRRGGHWHKVPLPHLQWQQANT